MSTRHLLPRRARYTALLVGLTVLVTVWTAILSAMAPARAGADPLGAAIEDRANILTDASAEVSAAIDTFTAKTGITVTVATANDTGGQPIQAYATGRAAALGRDQGQAVVVGADMGGRNLGIYTTPATERRLPNSELNGVVTNVLAPGFKQHQYGQAILDSLSAIDSYLASAGAPPGASNDSFYLQMWLLGGFGLVLAAAGIVARMIVTGNETRQQRRSAEAHHQSARRDEVEALKPELEALASPRERFELAHSRTGVTASEWNLWYPSWFYYDMSRAVASTAAADAAVAASASSSSSFVSPDYSSSYSPSFDSSSSFGGFSDGGGASACF